MANDGIPPLLPSRPPDDLAVVARAVVGAGTGTYLALILPDLPGPEGGDAYERPTRMHVKGGG